MGLRHRAKKGTTIEVSGPATVVVRKGTSVLEITAEPGVNVAVCDKVTTRLTSPGGGSSNPGSGPLSAIVRKRGPATAAIEQR